MAAINAVIVVPMLAPIMNGAACFRLTIFLATIGTTTDVVIVLERIAAVVSNPHAKDFNWLLKKKRLKPSGDLAIKRLEINFLKMRIEVNNRTSARTVKKNALGICSMRKLLTGVRPNQKCVADPSAC